MLDDHWQNLPVRDEDESNEETYLYMNDLLMVSKENMDILGIEEEEMGDNDIIHNNDGNIAVGSNLDSADESINEPDETINILMVLMCLVLYIKLHL